MFEAITLHNFKAFFNPQVVPLSRVTIFVGANGTGKSTPIQALMLLKQSQDSGRLVWSGNEANLVDYPDMDQLVNARYRGQQGSMFVIGFVDEKTIEPVPFSDDRSPVTFRYAGKWYVDSQGAAVGEHKISFDGITVTIESSNDLFLVDGPESLTLGAKISRPRTIGSAFQTDKGHNPVESWKWAEAARIFQSALNDLHYVPWARELDSASYQLQRGTTSDNLFPRDPYSRQAALVTEVGERRDLQDTISSWYKSVTGVEVGSRIYGASRIGIDFKSSSGWLSSVHEGSGTNQLLRLLFELAVSPPNATILIEEPELYLHPLAQASLAQIFLQETIDKNKQLVIATHSEHMVYPYLSAINRGDLQQGDVVIDHFTAGHKGSSVTSLEIDRRGRLPGGLPGFFESDVAQLTEYLMPQ